METNQIATQQQAKPVSVKQFFAQENVQSRFKEMLGKRAPQFITSVLQIAASNTQLANADPISIYNAAAVAATLDLPLNNSLGFAYIVPYNQRGKDGQFKQVAQFQIGYKGFIQLAQRTGQYKTISATPIYDGQLIEQNPLTGFRFDFSKKNSETIIGFAGLFQLINGFEKTLYMSVEEMKAHGLKYSKTFKSGLWQTDFIGMGNKTVIKLLISKFGPMSIEMQKAVITDQGVINDAETEDVTYVDNETSDVDKAEERIRLMIEDANSIEDLENISGQVVLSPEMIDLVNEKKALLDEQTDKGFTAKGKEAK